MWTLYPPQVWIKNDTLHIEGERKDSTDTEEKGVKVQERVYGNFSRQIALPPHIVKDSIQARMEDGVLHLTLEKTPEFASEEVKTIEIE